MPWVETDFNDVLEAVMRRLIDQVEGFTASNCVISDETEPSTPFSGNVMCFVSPMGGEFDAEWLVGGGEHQCKENTGVLISVWTQMKLDPKQRTEQALTNRSRGLVVFKKRILKALTGHRLLDESGNELLTDLMAPRSSVHVRKSEESKSVGFSLSFSTDFLWNLT